MRLDSPRRAGPTLPLGNVHRTMLADTSWPEPLAPPRCKQGWLGTVGADAALALLPASQMGPTRIANGFRVGAAAAGA